MHCQMLKEARRLYEACKAGDTLSSRHVSSRTSRLTKCVRQQKFKRRAGMWGDQSSTSDHVT
jgi:hypothetical protein